MDGPIFSLALRAEMFVPRALGVCLPLLLFPWVSLCAPSCMLRVPILTTLPSRSVPEADLTSKFATTFYWEQELSMSPDMPYIKNPMLMFPEEGLKAGEEWVSSAGFQSPSNQLMEVPPKLRNHPKKWKEHFRGSRRCRTSQEQGVWWAIKVLLYLSDLRSPGKQPRAQWSFGTGWGWVGTYFWNSSNHLAQMILPFLSGDRVLGLKSTEISDHNEEIQLPLPLSFPHFPPPLPCVQTSRNSRARAHRFSLRADHLPKLCTIWSSSWDSRTTRAMLRPSSQGVNY